MQTLDEEQWLRWTEQLRAIAQNGLAFCDDVFDIERYHQLRDIAHDMMAQLSGAPRSAVDNYFIGDEGYTTPKLDIRAGVFKDDKILLVQERSDGRPPAST